MRAGPALSSIVAGRPSVAKKNVSYNFASGKPVGMLETASRSDMLPLVLSGGTRLQEDPASGSTWAPLHWFGSAPVADAMATVIYRATMIVGNGSSGTNRGALVWVGGKEADGSPGILNKVYFRMRGQAGNAALIGTAMGVPDAAMDTPKVTASNTIVAPNDTIGLEISVAAGIYTYTGLKNGSPVAGAVWTDSANEFGTPGKLWGCGGYCQYSGGHFGSLGAYGMSCLDL